MILDVLSIDDKFLNDARRITDLAAFFDALQKTPGDPDKPLRILRNQNGGKVVAKFAFEYQPRLLCLKDEWRNLQLCQGPHVIKYIWGGFHQRDMCIVMEYAEPYGLCGNMRELVNASDMEFRTAFFQVIFTLSAIQKKYPGFRHNDLKADNVLVTYGPACSYAFTLNGLRRTFFTPAGVYIKIIDLELATTPNHVMTSTTVDEGDLRMREHFGISSERCDVYDIHLLAYDCLRTQTPTTALFKNFLQSFISASFFDPVNLTSQMRLSFQDQTSLQQVLGEDILLQMMCHPYFFHLRSDKMAETQNEI